MTNDLCTGGNNSISWSTAARTGNNNNNYNYHFSSWAVTPAAVPIASTETAIAPANPTGTNNQDTPTLYQVSGAWSYTPNTTFSGVITRQYWNNRTTGCATGLAALTIVVKPTARNDTAAPVVAWATGGTPLNITGDVLSGLNGTADEGLNAAGTQINTATNVDCADFNPADVCAKLTMANGGDGSWTFSPVAGWSGIVQVRYTATGAGGTSQPAFLTITVTPRAFDDTASGLARDAANPQPPVTGNVLTGGTADIGNGLHVVTHDAAQHGSLTINPDGSYSYVPDDDWSGTEQIDYTAYDADGQPASAKLTITITPRGVDDAATTPHATTISCAVAIGQAGDPCNVLTNDIGRITAATAHATQLTPAASLHGSFTLNSDGTWSYTPNASFGGDESIQYQAQDLAGQTYTAYLRIHVPIVFHIEKLVQDDANDWVRQDGFVFGLFSDAQGEHPIASPTVDAVGAETGYFEVDDIAPGHYWLIETQAMSGFELQAEAIGFTVGSDGALSLDSGASCPPTGTELVCVGTDSGGYLISVRDATAVVLPKAGGPGTGGFTAGGILLLAAAAGLGGYWIRRQRHPRGRHAKPTS